MNRVLQFFAGSPLRAILTGMAVLTAIGLAVASLFMPFEALVGQLGKAWPLIAAMTGIPSAFLIVNMIRDRIFSQVSHRFTGVLDGQPGEQSQSSGTRSQQSSERASSAQSLTASFKDALGVLRRRCTGRLFGNGWLYQLPWYLFIGTPGSGKTTAIGNSGLSFPLADKRMRYAAPNAANRRDLNWCFTDEAVLLDSSGRFLTQDDNPARDRGDWLILLGLLKRHRRRQPLNGIVVTVGIDELLSEDEASRSQKATDMRKRIGEIYAQLGSRLPVYVLFTKSDLLSGFVEFFDDLGREGRDAVLGITFQTDSPEQLGDPELGADEVEMFSGEFDALVKRLEERLLERMQHETDIQRRARIFALPQQLMSMKDALSQFLYEAFAPNTFDDPVVLRGTYFVSSMQAGRPIDVVGDAVARTFHISSPPASSAQTSPTGYFLKRLFREVVFLEAWLVEKDKRLARRMRRFRIATISAICLAALTVTALSYSDYRRQDALVAKVSEGIATFEKRAAAMKLENVTSGDLKPVAPLLDELRLLKTEVQTNRRMWAWMEPTFVTRTLSLESETSQAYRASLNAILLPRLLHRLESQLGSQKEDSAFLYPGLHVYLMLGGDGTFVPETIRQWMVLDWAAQYPQPEDAALRASLAAHLDAMLQSPLEKIALDDALVERTRVMLRKTPIEKRVFNAIVRSPEARNLPVFDIAAHAGPSAGEILQLRSGEPLSSRIPGLFTRDGFFSVYLPLLARESEIAVKRAWILVDKKQRAPVVVPALVEQVKTDATGLYLQEFSFKWDQLINGIAVKPIATLDDSLRALNILSAPTSPIRLLVATAAQQTSLVMAKPEAAPIKTASAVSPAQPPEVLSQNIATLFPVAKTEKTPESIAEKHTSEHFRALQQLINIPANSGPNAQAPIDGAITELATLYRALTAIPDSAATAFDRSLPNAVALQRLPAAAANLPDPIRQWFSTVVQKSSDISIGDAKTKLAELWVDGPGKFCNTATARRYPFVKNSSRDIALNDFGRLFGQQGLTDTFFSKNVEPFMNAAQRTANRAATVDKATLAQFEKASAIRESMFNNSGTEPLLNFELSIVKMDKALANVIIDIHGQQLVASAAGGPPTRFRWPASGQFDAATITIFPADRSTPIQFKATGDWALFRLFDMSNVRLLKRSEELQATFKTHGYQIVVGVQSDRLTGPIGGNLLSQFRCPEIF
ncbi:type VI secretion system membrane subunit TssM [Pararhizobium arenae]|uniref:type VI secretion system membrane subunit TssM n=1 Tax=Pararhizobium arenae TaxID=1856850 RepID=UPI00094B4BDC|nr:type VI secretion system membrane subunit TssM [Pararhizobium arenae]